MRKLTKQLVIIKETRERLRKDEISREDAERILSEIDDEYKNASSEDCDGAIYKCFDDLHQKDRMNRLNPLT
jgi:hypothetical protein